MVAFERGDSVALVDISEYWISAEEWLCNFISDYGIIICNIANYVLLDDIIEIIPSEYERLIS